VWNALLQGTTHHLSDAQLLNQLEAHLEPSLANAVLEEDIKERDLDQWLTLVKNLNDKKHRERRQQRADAEEAARAHLKHTGTTAGLSEPSRRYNRSNVNNAPSGSTPVAN
jgi:hypothetical protein